VSDEAARRSSARHDSVRAELARLEKRRQLATLRRPEVRYDELVRDDPERPDLAEELRREVETEAKYAGYVRQAELGLARHQGSDDGTPIPDTFDWGAVAGLSTEVREKLTRLRPATLGQARRVPGVTPPALTLVLIALHRKHGPQPDVR